MKKVITLFMKPSNFVFFLLFFLSSAAVWAQKGTIRGTVIEDEIGEPLFSASIAVKGTTNGAVTDFDGKFQIAIEPGTYNLEVSFISMQPVTITGVVVKSGDVTVIDNVRLKPQSSELEGVTVTAEAIRSTEAALLTIKKKSVNVMDGISSQNFRKIGDNDAATAVTRVPGVSVQGGKYVFVRGLGDRYTKTQLSGMDIPGLDPDRNSLQMDIFPTNIIDNIIVLKSFTADLPADFTGGVVNIETKDFPDRKTLNISASAGYNPDMHFRSDYLRQEGSPTDWLGFDNGSRSLPINKYTVIPSAAANDPFTSEVTRQFNPNLKAMQGNSFMDYNLGLSGGNQYQREKVTIGFSGALSYRNSTEFYDNRQWGEYIKEPYPSVYELTTNEVRVGNLGINNVLLSGVVGGALKTQKSKYRLNLMHLQNGESSAAYLRQEGFVTNSVTIFKDYLQYSERSISNALLSGEHVNKDATWNIEWKLAPTLSKIEDKDIRTTPYRYSEGEYSIEPSEAESPTRIWRNLDEMNLASKVDFTREHKIFGYDSKLKFGTAYIYKQRDFEILDYLLEIEKRGSIDFTGNANELLRDDMIWSVEHDTGSYIIGNYQPANTYSGTQMNFSAYVSEEFQVFNRLKSIIGVRMEKYDQYYTGQNQLATEVYDNEKIMDLTDFFPSVNFIYALHENANLRLSYSRTTARPSFKEKSVAQIYDPLTGRTFIGNIDLVQTYINNFDVRWEMFQDKGQTIAISAFYKTFENPIELVAYSAFAADNFQPRNLGDAQVYGVELEVRKNLAFIAPSLESLFFNANVSFIESRLEYDKTPGGEFESRQLWLREGETIDPYRDMQGQAPYLINTGLSYTTQESGWEVGLFYNVQGKRLAIVGIGKNPDVYEIPFHSLNLNALKSFGKKNQYQLGLGIDNILNDKREMFYESYNSSDKVFSSFNPGRSFSLRFRYSLL